MTLIKTVSHDTIKPFVKECFDLKGSYRTFYIFFSLISFAGLAGLTGYSVTRLVMGDTVYIIQLGAALLFCLTLLIILHELLHALAYAVLGARHLYFGANLKKFVFYVGSDGDFFSGKQFRIIALSPFIGVLFLSILLLITAPQYTFFSLFVICLHSFFCGGDFGMLNYAAQFPDKQFFTSDSRKKKETYFFLKDPI
ncbi:DUF3267 domain-containing protein [Ascidiimonas aurantiaca]|uniref:DUF3267 domain-containing protein n=1 Tax=Ascidiimonas aurantiaca TaxID=1685432 RepID=UPI0030EC18B2